LLTIGKQSTENSKFPEKFEKNPVIQVHVYKQSKKVSFIFNEFARTVDLNVHFQFSTKNLKFLEIFEKILVIQIHVRKQSGKVSFIFQILFPENFEKIPLIQIHVFKKYGKV
jgi:hypothetical protein